MWSFGAKNDRRPAELDQLDKPASYKTHESSQTPYTPEYFDKKIVLVVDGFALRQRDGFPLTVSNQSSRDGRSPRLLSQQRMRSMSLIQCPRSGGRRPEMTTVQHQRTLLPAIFRTLLLRKAVPAEPKIDMTVVQVLVARKSSVLGAQNALSRELMSNLHNPRHQLWKRDNEQELTPSLRYFHSSLYLVSAGVERDLHARLTSESEQSKWSWLVASTSSTNILFWNCTPLTSDNTTVIRPLRRGLLRAEALDEAG